MDCHSLRVSLPHWPDLGAQGSGLISNCLLSSKRFWNKQLWWPQGGVWSDHLTYIEFWLTWSICLIQGSMSLGRVSHCSWSPFIFYFSLYKVLPALESRGIESEQVSWRQLRDLGCILLKGALVLASQNVAFRLHDLTTWCFHVTLEIIGNAATQIYQIRTCILTWSTGVLHAC